MNREYSLDELAEDIGEIKSTLRGLTVNFVSVDVFNAFRAADAAAVLAAKNAADKAMTIAMWAIGILATLCIAGVFAFVQVNGQ